MRKTLFQYALIWHPTEAQAKAGETSQLIQEPTWILAKDQATASLQVARAIPEKYIEQLDQVEIAITPF